MPRISNQESISPSWPLALFATLVAASIALWWSSLASLLGLASGNDQYTHILLILPISAALILLEPKSSPPAPALDAFSFALLVVAGLMNAIVRWRMQAFTDVQLSLNTLALVAWWISAFAFCFGERAFRRSLFPLCFLFWIVPLPQFILNPVVSLLQYGSAASAHLLFLGAGIPVAQRGLLVHIPGLTLEVAPECSSIRSSMMLLVTTMVLAHLFLRSSWRKALAVAAAIPLSIAKNGLRIFALGVLATRVDPGFLTGKLHREGGVIFFLIALAAIFLVLWILRRGESRKPRIRGTQSH